MKLFLLGLLIFLGQAFAKDSVPSAKLILENYYFKNLSARQNSILRSITVNVAAEQKDYMIIIKDSNLGVEQLMYKLELEINKKKGVYQITARIRNALSKKVYKEYIANNVLSDHLILRSEYALRLIFELENTQAFKEIEKKLPTTTASKKNRQKRKNNSLNLASTSKEKIDFRKRIMDIKSDIPQKINEAKEENTNKEKNQNKTKSSSNNLINKEKGSDNQKRLDEIPLQWVHKYSLGAGYSIYSVEVQDSRIGIETLNISNDLSLLKLEGLITTTTPYSKKIKLRGSFNYFNIRTENEIELEDFYEMSLLIGYEYLPYKFYLGLSTETLVFGSVPTIGGEIQPSTIDNYNLQLWTSFTYRLYDASLAISRVFMSSNSSEHDISTESASSLNMELMLSRRIIELSKKIIVYTSMERKHYSNEIDIDVSSSRISFGAHYSF
jgi:hypothetical protein